MKKLLPSIQSPKDLKSYTLPQLQQICTELRQEIIAQVAQNGGHLGASLGAVELITALHTVFDAPQDTFIFDVGHQAYAHKLLTGRQAQFHTNRQWGGLAGFPSRNESEYDAFGTGHSSTSLSAILGMAQAHFLARKKNFHIALIGDGALTAGLPFEALNNIGRYPHLNILIVLNDNGMSIDENVGVLVSHLNTIFEQNKNQKFGTKPTRENLFTVLDLPYQGGIDGHHLETLLEIFSAYRQKGGLQVLHCKTEKGKGVPAAAQDRIFWHAPSSFDSQNFEILPAEKTKKYQDVVGDTLLKLAQKNEKIVVITPAMATGSSLREVQKAFPDRCFDVGIAEQHAVTFAAGIAAAGGLPFCVIYSTFLQRAYDQLIHDVCLQNLKVVFCIDRAGLVGNDGATHQGVFDVAFLLPIPNLILAAPADGTELAQFLEWAAETPLNQTIAIRYPRGKIPTWELEAASPPIELGRGRLLRAGKTFAIFSFGAIAHQAQKAIQMLDNQEDNQENNHIEFSQIAHYHLRFAKPLDEAWLLEIIPQYEKILIVEENTYIGGVGAAILQWVEKCKKQNPALCRVAFQIVAIADAFVGQGSTEAQLHHCNLDASSLATQIKTFFSL
ncbi:1-deoxy-D-xylulose-5-phosphate synthase [Hugenholtzia roseola]|uniref:1-deoxy-D-xylulose-5-phosphate synthase n=1 Tax=Hugenholtzia roseola TaxID=1002 RepID=UPI000411C268|nr:1-deoxy-D-xylulose-5-phosphate synthase [Hugenholtzia roseola]